MVPSPVYTVTKVTISHQGYIPVKDFGPSVPRIGGNWWVKPLQTLPRHLWKTSCLPLLVKHPH